MTLQPPPPPQFNDIKTKLFLNINGVSCVEFIRLYGVTLRFEYYIDNLTVLSNKYFVYNKKLIIIKRLTRNKRELVTNLPLVHKLRQRPLNRKLLLSNQSLLFKPILLIKSTIDKLLFPRPSFYIAYQFSNFSFFLLLCSIFYFCT